MRRSKTKFRPSVGTKPKSNEPSKEPLSIPPTLSPSVSQTSISTLSTPSIKAEQALNEKPPTAIISCSPSLPDVKPVIPDIKPILQTEFQPPRLLSPPPPLIKKPDSPKPSARRAKTKFRPSGKSSSPSRAPALNLSPSGKRSNLRSKVT